MRYVTRKLYQDIQTLDESGEIDRRWKSAWDSYRKVYERDRGLLPSSMQKFSEVTLHDGVIQVANLYADELLLRIDASNNPWGPRGIYEVRFAGVDTVEGLDSIVGDDWLYEEVHAHPVGFDYQVLLWRSELRVIAATVEMLPVAAQPPG